MNNSFSGFAVADILYYAIVIVFTESSLWSPISRWGWCVATGRVQYLSSVVAIHSEPFDVVLIQFLHNF